MPFSDSSSAMHAAIAFACALTIPLVIWMCFSCSPAIFVQDWSMASWCVSAADLLPCCCSSRLLSFAHSILSAAVRRTLTWRSCSSLRSFVSAFLRCCGGFVEDVKSPSSPAPARVLLRILIAVIVLVVFLFCGLRFVRDADPADLSGSSDLRKIRRAFRRRVCMCRQS